MSLTYPAHPARTILAPLLLAMPLVAAPHWLALPTTNHAIFDERPDDFYMYVDRCFEGRSSKPWQAGSFGFVRNPLRHQGKVVYTRFHEGVDIKPRYRDQRGEPLDFATAAAAGSVVHASTIAGNSNYGKYVVIEHLVEGCRYYTLYAHLATVTVKRGAAIEQGAPIGRIGYTGVGLNRERAHLHYEFCLLYNAAFKQYYRKYHGREADNHGIYNGMNLFSLDPVALTAALHDNPDTTVVDYIATLPPLFKLTFSAATLPDVAQRYPWLLTDPAATATAWSITLSDQFVPLQVAPAPDHNGPPCVEWLGPATPPLKWQSRNYVAGTAASPTLTTSGLRLIDLFTIR